MGQNQPYLPPVVRQLNEEYCALRAGLRMNIIANPRVEKTDFELWSLAVSAINGCGMCLDAHEDELRRRGFSATQVQTARRIAAVVNAVSASRQRAL